MWILAIFYTFKAIQFDESLIKNRHHRFSFFSLKNWSAMCLYIETTAIYTLLKNNIIAVAPKNAVTPIKYLQFEGLFESQTQIICSLKFLFFLHRRATRVRSRVGHIDSLAQLLQKFLIRVKVSQVLAHKCYRMRVCEFINRMVVIFFFLPIIKSLTREINQRVHTFPFYFSV